MSRLNDIVNGEDGLTYKETAEVLKTLLANYFIAQLMKVKPDEVTIYTLAIDNAIKALENADTCETESVYNMAAKCICRSG